MKFNCRVCGGNDYEKHGSEDGYFCQICGVKFLNPELFTIPTVKCKIIGVNGKLPEKNKHLDSGYDLFSAEQVTIEPGETVMVKTNIAIDPPLVYEAQVRARSGLAKKYGIQIANGPGTIDWGYRNNVGILLYNSSKEHFGVLVGDRIAQLVFKHAPQINIELAEELSDSDRGLTGFGDSGISGSIKN
jgi:dUTP pyrophosphatase